MSSTSLQRTREPTRGPVTRSQAARSVALVERVRYTTDRTRIFRVVSLILSLLAILGMLVIVVSNFIDAGAVSFYRAAILAPHGFLALLVLGAYTDQEQIDLGLSIAAAFIALLGDSFVLIVDAIRLSNCVGAGGVPGSNVDLFICVNEPTLQYISPIVAGALTLFALVQLIVLFIWLSRRRDFLASLANRVLFRNDAARRRRREAGPLERDVRSTGGTPYAGLTRDATLFDEAERRRAVNQMNTISDAGGLMWLRINQVLGVLMVLAVLLLAALNVAFFTEVSFYRGAFIIVPAHLGGALLSYMGTVPSWWRFITLAFGLLSLISAVYATIVELPRYIRCVSAGGVPSGQIEQGICDDSAWRGGVWPILSLVVGLISLVAVIGVFASFGVVRRALTRRQRPL